MQNPSGHHPATAAPSSAPSKGKSSAPNPSGHHAATPAPSGTPSKGKSAAAQAAASGQGSSSHHHSAGGGGGGGGADASATTLKRKRGVFQKDRTGRLLPTLLIFSLCSVIRHSINLLLTFNFMCCIIIFVDVLAVQHMMYGFGDDPNVSLLNNFLFSSLIYSFKDMLRAISQSM
jgi:transcription initiation factor TFIID subunit 13